jgi:Uma2 family endonuclease
MHTELPFDIDKSAFLAWGQQQEGRYELADGRVVKTPAQTRTHALTVTHLISLMSAHLDEHTWEAFLNFGVETGPRSLRYPDIVVDRASGSGSDLTATAPVLLAEVMSRSTAEIDLGDKLAEYLRLPSLSAYIVLAEDEPKAWMWMRPDGRFRPSAAVITGLDEVIRVAELQPALPLGAVYAHLVKS